MTLRCAGYEAATVAPAQWVKLTLTKRWTWAGSAYATGSIDGVWTDIPALGLTPLPLEDQGFWDLAAIHPGFEPSESYAALWTFFASHPRRAFEFDDTAWSVGDGTEEDSVDADASLVVRAAECIDRDPAAARKLLMDALLLDLRCIDAHVHLGNLVFDRHPKEAMVHYTIAIAIAIADLSLSANFTDMLPWACLNNRPLLRALHGHGLCLWRLGKPDEARRVFERLLILNPADNQGARICWDDIRNGKPWPANPSAP